MLKRIRIIADSFVIRCLLALIAFAFVGWGIKDVLQDENNFDVITFKYAPNISNHEFLKSRAETISYIQKKNQIHLDDDEIKSMNIDGIVTKNLINQRMIDYLVDYYELDLSEATIVQYLKQLPEFKDDKGNFNIDLLKASMHHSGLKNSEYIDSVEKEVTKNTVIKIFTEGFLIPKALTQNMIDYLATNYNVDLVKINLDNQKKIDGFIAPNPEQLAQFYQANIESFKIPEMRNIKYLKITNEYLSGAIPISDEEITNFYNENKDELDNQPLVKAKSIVEEKIRKQKYDQHVAQVAKDIEDSVASGSSLDEIGERLKIKTQILTNISEQNILAQKIPFAELVDNVLEMRKGEVSYPVELKDKSGILLVEIQQITPSFVQEYEVVREKLLKAWETDKFKQLNQKTLENLAKNYVANKVDIKNLAARGISVDQKFNISRNEISNNKNLPSNLLAAIFQTQVGNNTAIFVNENAAYFAHLKSKNINPKKTKEIYDASNINIEASIKNQVLEELIEYLVDKNEVKIKL